ncbi:MAG: ABC transporter permease [Jatrophihabitantaceae bacterium]
MSAMTRRSHLARHSAGLLAVAAIVVVLTFVLVRVAPGNTVTALTGNRGTAASHAALRARLGLDDPLLTQFWHYVNGLFHGDLGSSLVQQGRPVSAIIGDTLPVTLSLIVATIVVSAAIGVPLGLLAAINPVRGSDLTVRVGLSLLLASPPFFLGLLLIIGPALAWGWAPAGGWPAAWPDAVRYLMLPSLALAGYLVPILARTVRQVAADTMREQWYEAAIARGLSRFTVISRHLLPNSLLPVITLLALNAGALVAGAVVVEAVFGLPGIGQELITSIQQRDYPCVQGIALVTALIVVACNLIADVLYQFVDPRTRRA